MLSVRENINSRQQFTMANNASIGIHSTRDYDKFRFSEANRPIDEKHLDRLTAAIDKNNLLHRFPIKVSTEFIVLDGQHRLKAAQRLHVPIWYEITDDITIENVSELTKLTKHWRPSDYLNYWRRRGIVDYQQAYEFLQDHPSIGLLVVTRYGGVRTKDEGEQFRNGEWKFVRKAFLEAFASHLAAFSQYGSLWKSFRFQQALLQLMALPEYDKARMMRQVDKLSTRLVKCTSRQEYVALLNTIYNYAYSDKHRVNFAGLISDSSKNSEKGQFRRAYESE